MFLELIQIQPLDETDTLYDASADSLMEEIWEADEDGKRWQRTKIYIDPKTVAVIEPHPIEHVWTCLELSLGKILVIDMPIEEFLGKLQYASDLERIQPLKKIFIN